MTAMPMGALAMQPKMAEGASLFRPTLAGVQELFRAQAIIKE
jgi:hypothetical protein